MSYNPSALAAAMNRSLKFTNIPFTDSMTILKLEPNSEYKLHLKIGEDIIDCDILGNKIIRVNSNLRDQTKEKKFGLALNEDTNKLLFSVEKDSFDANTLDLEIEYSFDNFEILNDIYEGDFNGYEFGKQIYSNLRTDNLVTTGSLNIKTLNLSSDGEIKANSIKIGNWVISKGENDSELSVSIMSSQSEGG